MTKQELLHQTLAVWQPRVSRKLTDEDAREITETLAGFFDVLAEWAEKDRPSPTISAEEVSADG